MVSEIPTVFEWTLLGIAVLTVLLPVAGLRWGIPVFLLVGRWLRWILFAALFTFCLKAFELSYRPDWVLFVTGLGVWFLLETGYNWLAIKALSRSDLPLFPKFQPNRDGDEWPADKRLIEVREWLRNQNFRRLSALKAELFEGVHLRSSIYESEDRRTRVQILFIPKRRGGASACYTITTNGQDGRRLITDNLFLPFGGYYPDGWELVRKPLIGSLRRLLALHEKRLRKSTIEPVPFEEEPLDEINAQQRILERINLETGFLLPPPRQEEEGRISHEGRYRLWKEMWLMAYFGRAVV